MKVVISYLSILISIVAYSQPELRFKRYTVEDGLPNNDVVSMYQDHLGFIWFAPLGALSRFDGIHFKNYKNTSNAGSLISGWVFDLTGDQKNRLWVCLGENLTIYNYDTDAFFEVKLLLPGQKVKQSIGGRSIYCDSKGMIWHCGYETKVLIIDPDNLKVIKQFSMLSNPQKINEDRKGFIWIGSLNEGVIRYNRENDTYVSYRHNPNDISSLSNDVISAIYEDSSGTIWIGTENGGLNKYIAPTEAGGIGKFKHFKHEENNKFSLSNNCIYTLAENSNGNLCVGTLGGLSIKNGNTETFFNYFYDDRDNETLNDNIVRCLNKDKTGNLWIGTRSGVAKQKKQYFKTFQYSSYKKSISSNKVEALYADKDDRLFIGTPQFLDIYNKTTNRFSVFAKVEKDSKSNLSGPPTVIYPDPGDALWIGTWQGGLNYLNLKTNTYSHYLLDNNNVELANNNNVFSVLKDDEEHLWIGTWGGGLLHYNIKTLKFEQIRKSTTLENIDGLSSDLIRCLEKDNNGNLWIGTLEGLDMLMPSKPYTFKHFLNFGKNTDSYVRCIYKGKDSCLWIGAGTGLFRVQFENDNIEIVNPGLKQSVMSILEDSRNNLWVATYKNIVKLENAYPVNGTKKEVKITVFGKQNGLQREYKENRACKLKDGTMFFGGSEGLSMFHPDSIAINKTPPYVVLTNLLVHNKAIQIGDTINKQIILKQSITKTRFIEINHKNNDFTITFAALHYDIPIMNRYAYKLQNYEEDWQYTDAIKNEATFMNLPQGEYTFYVKACNSDGIWNDKPLQLKIKILPPWWQKWWFRISLALVIVCSSILFFYWRVNTLKRQKKLLEQKVSERTFELKEMNFVLKEGKEEIEQQMLQMADMNKKLGAKSVQIEDMAKQLHEADQKQLRFFANISHEFRTPLTLIMGPLEKYAKIKKLNSITEWDKIRDYLQLAHRNALRLSRLINQILDFRKLSQNVKQLNLQNNNIIEFIQEVVHAFSEQTEAKNIQLIVKNEKLIVKSEKLKVKNEELKVKSEELKVKSEELRVKSEENSIKNLHSSLITHHSSLYTNFWFDPDIMEKILYNLISNAIKYTLAGGEISIAIGIVETLHVADPGNVGATSLQKKQLAIKITDTGIGIKPENINKIFDRFYRVETHGRASLHENQPEGTGIGLAYTKELLEFHKGSIHVESSVGQGTSFSLLIPFLSKEKSNDTQYIPSGKIDNNLDYIKKMAGLSDYVQSMPEMNPDKQTISHNQQDILNKVLFIDDSADMREYLYNELRDTFRVTIAKDGVEGFETAIRENPDLIISDVMMPGLDGTQLCAKLKTNETTSHIPVILLTAKAGDENILKGIETRADDYILKPFNIDILKAKIIGLIENRKALREKFSSAIFVSPDEMTTTSLDSNFIRKAIEVVEKHMHEQEFDNNQFVSYCNLSRATVYKKIKSLTNQSVSEFIRTIRLKKAAKMLLSEDKTVGEIGFLVGFSDKSNFTRYFTKHFGKTPSQFIQDSGVV